MPSESQTMTANRETDGGEEKTRETKHPGKVTVVEAPATVDLHPTEAACTAAVNVESHEGGAELELATDRAVVSVELARSDCDGLGTELMYAATGEPPQSHGGER